MSTRESVLQDAFFAAVPAAVDATKLPNATFKPEGRNFWFELFHLPNRPVPVTCGRQGEDEGTGLMQINVMIPIGHGDKEARDTEALLRSAFTAGQSFPYSSGILKARECGRSGPGLQAGNFWSFPIDIYWETRLPRNA